MVSAIMEGQVVEAYPERQRMLICGQVTIEEEDLFLHVVCEYRYDTQIDIVTAYIPNTIEWDTPPTRRKPQRKK